MQALADDDSCPSTTSNSGGGGFKVLDISDMDIVYRGKEWTHPEDPSAKSMVHMLRWNESLVTWLQPKGGTVEDQIPAINVNGKYRTLSLRMQKSIWKHVRLRQGFVNLENLSQGGYKLKIPTMLLCEKERTRNRFAQVINPPPPPMHDISPPPLLPPPPPLSQKNLFFQMRKKEESTKDVGGKMASPPPQQEQEKEKMGVQLQQLLPTATTTDTTKHALAGKKHARTEQPKQEQEEDAAAATKKARAEGSSGVVTTNTTISNKSLHKKIHHAVVNTILPLCAKDRRGGGGGGSANRTCFVVTESDALRKIARDILRKCPKLASSPSRKDLLVKLLELMQQEEEEAQG